MKEFHSNNVYINLFNSNREKFDFIKNKILEKSKTPNFNFLKDSLKVFVRETITAKFLNIELVREKIPSFHFQTKKFRDLLPNLFIKTDFKTISEDSCLFLFEDIIKKDLKLNKSSASSLAKKIFSSWKESILFQETNSKLNSEFQKIFTTFIKKKGNLYTDFEITEKKIFNNKLISKEKIIELCGKELFLYGIFELNELEFKLVQTISEFIPVYFINNQIKIELISNLDENLKFEEYFNSSSVLKKILPKEKISELKTEFNLPKINFRECQEIYREIEFVGREILRKISIKHNSSHQFKIIVPDQINYHILVKQIFNRLNIPFATTRDISPRFSTFHQAIYSILNAIENEFEQESIFAILKNPCFAPRINDYRIFTFNREIWNQIIIQFNLDECLDATHKKELGFRESPILTWESLWKRLVEVELIEVEEDINSEIKESLVDFLRISKSLIYDLYSIKTEFKNLKHFAEFFKIFINEYLITKIKLNKEEQNQELISANEKTKTLIFNLLNDLISISEELDSLKIEREFSIQEFIQFVKSGLENSIFGSPNLIQSSVMISTLVDGLDPFFDEVFVLGLNENNFQNNIFSLQSFNETELIQKNKELDLKNKLLFNYFFSFNAKEIHLSYINLDSVKDKILYPHYEYTYLEKKLDQKRKLIPILAIEEEEMILKFESKTLNLQRRIHQINNSQKLTKLIPKQETDLIEIEKELNNFQEDEFRERIKTYFIRKSNFQFIEEKKTISASALTSFTLCSKNYFFDSFLNLEGEEKSIGKIEEIKGARLKQIYQILIFEFLNSIEKSFNLNQFLDNELNTKKIEKGLAPYGILNQIEKEKLIKHISEEILPELEKEKYELKTIKNSIIESYFTSIQIDEAKIKLKFEYYKIKNNEISFYLLSSSANEQTKTKNLILLYFSLFLFLKFADKEKFKDLLQIENLEFKIGILDLAKNFQIKEITYTEIENQVLDSCYHFFLKSEILPKPFSFDVCNYCNYKSNCEGYQYEFAKNLELDEIHNSLEKIISKKKIH